MAFGRAMFQFSIMQAKGSETDGKPVTLSQIFITFLILSEKDTKQGLKVVNKHFHYILPDSLFTNNPIIRRCTSNVTY